MKSNKNALGVTLLELIFAILIVATLASIAIPIYTKYKDDMKVKTAIADIRQIELYIAVFESDNSRLPDTLSELENVKVNLIDPWGNPYQYLPVEGTAKGKLRKDRFMVPVNTDYDLYSKGKDGRSQTPFTAPVSFDDVVRANDGQFVGLVADF